VRRGGTVATADTTRRSAQRRELTAHRLAEVGEHVVAVAGGLRKLLEDVPVLGDLPVLEAEDAEDGEPGRAGDGEGVGVQETPGRLR
jgi:hypothetical protein